MKNYVVISLMTLVVGALVSACSSGGGNPGLIGGNCTDSSVAGTATITSISAVADGVNAVFTFTPTDPSATPRLGEGTVGILVFTASGQIPSSNVLASNGITVGVTIPAVRAEAVTGDCTPVRYTFPTVPSFYGAPSH